MSSGRLADLAPERMHEHIPHGYRFKTVLVDQNNDGDVPRWRVTTLRPEIALADCASHSAQSVARSQMSHLRQRWRLEHGVTVKARGSRFGFVGPGLRLGVGGQGDHRRPIASSCDMYAEAAFALTPFFPRSKNSARRPVAPMRRYLNSIRTLRTRGTVS